MVEPLIYSCHQIVYHFLSAFAIEKTIKTASENNKMDSVCALICEYNPFHTGHKYQLEQLKKQFSHIVCIMSGATVQRGEFAIADKYKRAKAAVAEGADIVVELPYPYSSLGAKDFAAAGVHIASKLGIFTLGFGAEDDFSVLCQITAFLSEEATKEQISVLTKRQKNISYPKARQSIIAEKFGIEAGRLMTKPNNILAIEYMLSGGDRFNYYVVKRNLKLKSASFIRSVPSESLTDWLPKESALLYSNINRRDINNLDRAILAKLRTTDIESLMGIYDITPDLAQRLLKSAEKATNITELIAFSATKTDTTAKLRRAVLHSFIGGTKMAAADLPCFSNLLAARSDSLYLIKKKVYDDYFTLLSKPAHYKTLSGVAKEQFLLNAKAENLAALSAAQIEAADLHLRASPIIM